MGLQARFTKKFSTSHLLLNFNSALLVYFQHINKFFPGPQTLLSTSSGFFSTPCWIQHFLSCAEFSAHTPHAECNKMCWKSGSFHSYQFSRWQKELFLTAVHFMMNSSVFSAAFSQESNFWSAFGDINKFDVEKNMYNYMLCHWLQIEYKLLYFYWFCDLDQHSFGILAHN